MVNDDWKAQTHARARIVFAQIEAAARFAPSEEESRQLIEPNSPYFNLLEKLYGDDYPLARLLEMSDLVCHAEGPGASDHSPDVRAVNWLCVSVERNLRALAGAVVHLAGDTASKLTQALPLQLTGFAPGSLYAGFALGDLPPDLIAVTGNEPVMAAVRNAIRGLPSVASYIGDETVMDGISEALPDPAIRDASLRAAYALSPTGKMGIHTLELGSPDHATGSFSNRERIVLRRTAIDRPFMRSRKQGQFVGEIRELDLDRQRFHLRHVPDVGTIRCAWLFDQKKAARLIGATVRVTGQYETDSKGRPRLMEVSDIKPFQRQRTLLKT